MENVYNYLLEEKLGRGGMSVIYKARAPLTHRVVALKILRPRDTIFVDLVGEDRLREIFLEEARVMRTIEHRHVAGILDCRADGETPIIVLEYYPSSLGSLIGDSTRVRTTGVIDIDMAYRYIHQTLLGLEELHASGIIHRDIKPHNLMLDQNDEIKIIDFGLCTIEGEERMAIPGMQIGSPYYIAPEQERDPACADNRSDLYSVGVIAYRLLTGRLANHREEPVLPPSRLNNRLNATWDDYLLTSLRRTANDRFQTAYEMRRQLEEIYRPP